MDTFVDSSWYFLRFCSPQNNNHGFNQEEVDYWMPVDQYIGGVEHAILHLIILEVFYASSHYKNDNFELKNHLMVYLHKEWFVTKLIKIKIING